MPGLAAITLPSDDADDPFERAAKRQRLAVKPDGGRQEGPVGPFLQEMLIPQNPAEVAMLGLPGGLATSVGRKLGTKGLAALLGLTGAASYSDEAEAGPLSKLVKAAKRGGRAGAQVTDDLPMDETSRFARAVDMHMEPGYWRGERSSGPLPMEYPGGTFYSRDKGYASGFAHVGGRDEPREFWLDLREAFRDHGPLTASQYDRLIRATDPNMAQILAGEFDKTPHWFAEFARRNPDHVVVEPGSAGFIRHLIERNATHPIDTFVRAGFTALDSGRDVRTLTASGQRLSSAAFDPRRAQSGDIMAGLAGAVLPGWILGLPEGTGQPSQ
jgi:hypothetical protein